MKRKSQNINWDELTFNVIKTRSMFYATCPIDGNWSKGRLVPYGPISLSPAAGVLNYGQGVFEGTKAYHTTKNNIVLFRLDQNAKRMAWSTKRLCIPQINLEFFRDAVIATVKDNLDFVPPCTKGSLYIRPIIWGTAPALGVKPADEYTFIVFVTPVGPYFKGDVKLLNLKIECDYHRAALKGIGNAKAIGNYSASLYPMSLAKKEGFDEVIYLDSVNGKKIEELGSANIFIYSKGKLKTPKLSGSILNGVTRDSICHISSKILDIDVEETDIYIEDILAADEVFCTGTAVVVTPVGKITYKDTVHIINNGEIGPVTKKYKETLLALQYQEIDDPFGWLHKVI